MDTVESKLKQQDEATKQFFESLKRESDRGCALVAGQMLENSLEVLLRKAMSADHWARKHCVERLFGAMAPLGTYSAKILASGALGLIHQDMVNDLDTIRKIRNKASPRIRCQKSRFGRCVAPQGNRKEESVRSRESQRHR